MSVSHRGVRKPAPHVRGYILIPLAPREASAKFRTSDGYARASVLLLAFLATTGIFRFRSLVVGQQDC